MDYLDGNDPTEPGPVLLVPLKKEDADRRGWTHEVRIASPISLDKYEQIEAVFLVKNRLTNDSILRFFTDCQKNGIYTKPFDASKGNDFVKMQQMSIDYIKQKIGMHPDVLH